MLNRFLQILKVNEEKEKNEDEKHYKKTFNQFSMNFLTNSYHYEINENFLYKKYSNLNNIPTSVLTNIYNSIQSDSFFDSILIHKNKTVSKAMAFVPLDIIPTSMNGLTNEQLSYYYFLRQELLKGNFISKTNICYLYIFMYESIHYQLTNDPGLNFSILYRVFKHYSKKSEYQELNKIIPSILYYLLLEINEDFLAGEFMFIHENESFIKELKQPKDYFDLKKYNQYISVYEEFEYMRHRKKLDKSFKDLLFEYISHKNISLYSSFVKTNQKRQPISKRPFMNLKSNRIINVDEGCIIDYWIDDNFSCLLTDLYKLAYNYLLEIKVDYDYLNGQDVNYLLQYLKNKTNSLSSLLSVTDKETIQKSVIQKLIDINEEKEQKNTLTLSPEKEKFKKLINRAINYNSFLDIFKEESYFDEINSTLLEKHPLVSIDFIPDFLYKNYFKSIQSDRKTSFFYNLLNYRIHEDEIKSYENYQTILEYGISYINLLKEEQRYAYLSFRKEVLNNNFIPYVHVSYIYLLLADCMHLNLSSNPHFIMNLLDKISEHYKDKLSIEIQVNFYKQAFLKECLLEDNAKQFELNIEKNEIYKDLSFKDKIFTTELEKLTVTSFKKYINNYNELDIPAKVKTKTNKYFKELLIYIDELKDGKLIDSYILPFAEKKKVMKPYKKLNLYRLTPEVYYYETYEKFDNELFSEFITNIYLFAYHYANETLDTIEIEFEYINESLDELNRKYKKVKKEKEKIKEGVVEEVIPFAFNLEEIEELKKLHGVEKEEEKRVSTKKITNVITKDICDRFLSLFNDDECSVKEGEVFAKEYKIPLNKLITETNKQCKTALSVEDDMIYND